MFNFDYIFQHTGSYHDKALLDYLCVGFPFGLDSDVPIHNNASDNHQSAKEWSGQVQEFIEAELSHGALLGPFEESPHTNFTWTPFMTWPNGQGHCVILDLSFCDFSVNKATVRDRYDTSHFTLNLPGLDNLLNSLQDLGQSAHLFKVDISRTFRNIPVNPADAIHLGIKWQDKYYIDKHLAFGAVHGTAIFERISNFICLILACHGFHVWNYIDDIYICCHVNVAQQAFDTLLNVIRSIGLPINESKAFAPTARLLIMGIVVDVSKAMLSIEPAKLDEILNLCQLSLLRQRFTKREFINLLGKLLYISRCMKGARVFLNRMLAVVRAHHNASSIYPDEGFYQDLLWFVNFVKQFNGVVTFSGMLL